jgi:DNA invertase Pin-like site-specific DNA recombinase
MERDLIIERTQAGLARARAEGVKPADPRRRTTAIVTPYARGSRQEKP